ncbi:bifunctional diaminohydroxyphosphoribosylaminopyrimidine deaminase/5-amino-6-(5-phosphoribosylamino)uracil reductase RibD [Veillonella denticariosi JCM 15641]|uniref:Riboflavin biosynthesis protein RibD n=1 Tax=Veillonella denticariosi JCM 15641 TaxID=1298594 RepID=A0A2S7Z794_9FIRM|nr:bifunctional diaminohydroxyphosphoribosylaminopyrimidine deaminase/5-amino-6-(5-phosphoribosylamino)uracil reductase RibD [Veillonella denticariosi]PQL19144.1 bifunctional diaminohydroxyphosphoribosylaminopyrimidine deaminase/5-amino-6-(5-phosphoribosylamino)uracil reductase RibD [Veillonella denticariosi JCM 15641]
MMDDVVYMKRAIALAKLAAGHTAPNPLVGAVIVKDNEIVGEGYHHKAGTAHAEVHALDQAGDRAEGGTLYVTLEPCSHYGKTPPCALRIIESGIRRVVIGSTDPNPLVSGKGIAMLKEAGIEIVSPVCLHECSGLNEHFFTYIQTGKPFVTLKSAMSLDGKIATFTGQSQWITNESSRRDGHVLRATHDAMLIGIGTVLADDPQLNCRLSDKELGNSLLDNGILNSPIPVHQPDVIVLDSLGRTPVTSRVFDVKERAVHIFVSDGCPKERIKALENAGAIITVIETTSTRKSHKTDILIDIKKLSIDDVLTKLGDLGYTSLLVEGGSAIISSFVETMNFDKIVTYIGDTLIGGIDATPAVGGRGFESLDASPRLTFTKATVIDNNIRIEAYRQGRRGAYVHGNH